MDYCNSWGVLVVYGLLRVDICKIDMMGNDK